MQQEGIKDASRSKKEEFLQSKGLNPEEVRILLAESREDSEPPTGEVTAADVSKVSDTEESQENDDGFDPSSPQSTGLSDEAPRNAIPPIITYPEFLSRQQIQARPPALITTQRLLNTLYVSLSAYMLIYAGSQYIVKPMREQLNEARRDLQKYVNGKLEGLNERLETMVSAIPTLTHTEKLSDKTKDEEDEEDDIARCFHKNVGTQTSLSLEASPPLSSLLDAEIPVYSVVASHTSKLRTIRSNLGSLLHPTPDSTSSFLSSGVSVKDNEISESLRELQQSLDLLPYNTMSPGKEDVHGRITREIKAMKGTLLSARNFPSGVRGVIGAS